MTKQIFVISLITTFISFSLLARGPAVDNVVGVDTTDLKANPQNRAISFDFSNTSNVVSSSTSNNIPWPELSIVFLILGLPLFVRSIVSEKALLKNRKINSQVIEETAKKLLPKNVSEITPRDEISNVIMLNPQKTQNKVTTIEENKSNKKAA